MAASTGRKGLFLLDSLLEESAEHIAIGKNEDALAVLSQIREELEGQTDASGGGAPVDMLLRRVRTSLLLAEAFGEKGMWDQALIHAIEANSVARGPLSEHPEFLIQSVYLLCRLYAMKGELQPAKNYLSEAMKVKISGGDTRRMQAQLHFATGMIAKGADKKDVAKAAFGSVVKLLDGEDLLAEQIMLKAEAVSYRASLDGEEKRAKGVLDGFSMLCDSAGSRLAASAYRDAFRLWGKALKMADGIEGARPDGYYEALFSAAFLLEIRGRWDYAEEFYERLRAELAVAGREKSGLFIRSFAELGKIRSEKKHYKDAEVLLKEAEALAASVNDRFLMGLTNYYMGLNCSKSGSDEEGLVRFGRALAYVPKEEKSGESLSLRAFVANQYGFIERKKGGLNKAIKTHISAIEMLEGDSTSLARGEGFRFLGECYIERQQYLQAERALKHALDIFEKHSAYYEIAKTYRSIGQNCVGSGDIEKARFFIDESIELLQRLGIRGDLPMLYSERAKICILLEQYEEAEKFFQKDFEIAKASKNPHLMAFSYYQLGRVRRLLQRTHSGMDYLNRSVELFRNVGNRRMEAVALLELALAESEIKNVKAATDYCARAKDLLGQNPPADLQAKLLITRGLVLRDAKRRYMAQCCFEESIQIMEKENRITPELAEAYFEFGLFWNDGGNRKKAEELVMSAVELAEKIGLKQKVASYMRRLAQISPEAGAKVQLGRFMDKSTAEQLSRGKDYGNVRVERKNISILFTDIRGFTGTSERLSLDELSSFLNDFYNGVTQVVLKYRGRINKFIGDEVMALFNMDDDLEDHPVWAARAGCALVSTMEEINMIRGNRGETPINVGVGVNTGEVLLGIFGSSIRQEYTAIGDCVNVAARLQGQAKGGEVVVSDIVYQSIKNISKAEDMGEKPLKGKGVPLRLWKILDIRE
ncbi:MAG: adenylate/guanylate cyclase domain-containing protein [bacterium]